ncbi:Predicted flavoprotein CzcO associated with the cation diffusion facilitator CzcD [Actinokineospora alba]|uniref:Predicted flavoprotein CzcO associated with the cation diffusion facilitator CzcD n=1 Tax=Actinokineospora alba TaxID=504798 RepID=A0A1H0M6L1_9PSEU|nr:NAD(P)/FAD-dependent oxidoreductase [Actinokineospora alba]TDP67608.1 cation diffusion facilitator CzcD-associated flavoprotein CzcO [Actinokineospora alba]SDI44575.1 Predicted flavoprotein CzcO associated with the cation diffusion facilitator CzcD [Actinokineospora alba]SDO76118.1 Predicted flavoprotein CzcO associated with the cation diffusion facilitator CzcD [Actinokineospora alba]
MTRTIKPGRVDRSGNDTGGGDRRTPHYRVAVIGTGFSGLGMAIRLKQQGIDDFVVLERADEVGGTWRDNSYPGCACDVMSLLYSFSFAQNPNWSTTFGKRDEVYAYLRECADRFGVRPHIRFRHELVAAKWSDLERRWHIETSQGEFTAQVLVSGTGYLSDPVMPDIEGLDSFPGAKFHSANWDHDFDLTGKRVAVIGTGASAIQFVPKIQPKVGQLFVHQRTAPWVGPKADKTIGKGQLALRKNLPGYQNFRRNFNMWGREILAFMLARPKMAAKTITGMAEKNLKKQVKDPVLRARLTPDYAAGCKRLLFSNEWYPALQQPNVELVTDKIVRVDGSSVVTADGTAREVDAIILGTGFAATNRPVAQRLWGRDGVKLADAWGKGMSAYAGTTVAGFPNLFMLLGPNTTLGHSSQTVMIEAQIAHVLDALKLMDKRELSSVEVRSEAQTAYNARLDAKLEGTVWTVGGCQSWYMDGTDRNPSIWPTYTWRFRKATKRVDVGAYRIATSVGDPMPAVINQ